MITCPACQQPVQVSSRGKVHSHFVAGAVGQPPPKPSRCPFEERIDFRALHVQLKELSSRLERVEERFGITGPPPPDPVDVEDSADVCGIAPGPVEWVERSPAWTGLGPRCHCPRVTSFHSDGRQTIRVPSPSECASIQRLYGRCDCWCHKDRARVRGRWEIHVLG